VRPAVPAVDAGARRRLTARFGAAVEAWCDALPDVLVELAARWRFELGGQIPRGTMSAVYRCRLADGRAAVLKASPDRRRLADEAGALRGWRSRHSPMVHAFDEQRGVLLLEAVEPGTPLVVAAAHPSAEEVGALLAALHVAAAGPYPTVGRRVDHLFDSSTQCFYEFDVKSKVATIKPTQKCSLNDGVGGLIEEDPSSWTFTLTSASTADETFMTTIATTCTFSGMATLKKVSASN